MGANPHANGGMLLRDLRLPDFRLHAVSVPSPGAAQGQDTSCWVRLRDVAQAETRISAISGSSVPMRLSPIFWARFLKQPIVSGTPEQWKNDEFLAPAGRVLDSMLSENQCEGWLEGYLLTGRHGLFQQLMRPSFASSTRCSASTPSG